MARRLRRGGDQRRGDLRGAADDERVGVGEVGGELVGCPAGAGVDVPAFGAQQFERGGGKVVGDNDFHGMRSEKYAAFGDCARSDRRWLRKYNLRLSTGDVRTTIGANR